MAHDVVNLPADLQTLQTQALSLEAAGKALVHNPSPSVEAIGNSILIDATALTNAVAGTGGAHTTDAQLAAEANTIVADFNALYHVASAAGTSPTYAGLDAAVNTGASDVGLVVNDVVHITGLAVSLPDWAILT